MKIPAGDTVKGTLVLLAHKSYKAKEIRLEVYGIEETKVDPAKASKYLVILTNLQGL